MTDNNNSDDNAAVHNCSLSEEERIKRIANKVKECLTKKNIDVERFIESLKDFKIEKYEIKEIFGKSFYIPAYQRGYRWTKHQVIALCNDVYENYEQKKGLYCLQQLVVRKKDDSQYEVIDGQQRLTTISILMSVLGYKSERPIIEYETREGSKEFLGKINDDGIEKGNAKNVNVDYKHMLDARDECKRWMEGKDEDRLKASLEKCFFIWYETDSDPYVVFERLNSGKIALSNTELIKALILNRDLFSNNGDQYERAVEWDEMIRTFEHDDFWYFICPNSKLRKYNKCHADYLLHLLVTEEGTNDVQKPYALFEHVYEKKKKGKEELNSFWGKIKNYFNHIYYCFQNRDLYHLLGFCTEYKICSVENLINDNISKNYSDWKNVLKNRIKENIVNDIYPNNKEKLENLKNSSDEFENELRMYCNKLSYDDEGDKKKINMLLLLFNIATLQNEKSVDSRYPFHEHKKQEWSLEHIHARREKSPDDHLCEEYMKAAKKLWKDNEAHFDDMVKSISDSLGLEEEKEQNSAEEWRRWEDKTRIFDLFEYQDKDIKFNYETSMGNLALLPKDFNSKLNNGSFKDKRLQIKDAVSKKGSDTMIPLCTRNAFFKFYTPDDDINIIWHYKNAIDYIENIAKTITNYIFS